MTENCNPYPSPSKAGQAPVSRSEPKPKWAKDPFIFAVIMVAAYLALPALLLLDWLASGAPYLQEVFMSGIGPGLLGLLVFPWPLLAIYAIVVGVILSATSSFKVRCALGVPTLLVYTVAVYIRFAVYCVAG